MSKEILIKFGKKVRHLRKLRKMSQEELAFKIDVNRNYIGMIERAESYPSFEVICKISRALSVDLGTLFSFDKLEPNKNDCD